MNARAHLTWMLIAGGVVLVGLWVLGLPVGAAAPVAFFLACPLMMFFMMRGMNHDPQGGQDRTDQEDRPTSVDAPASRR